MLIVVKSDNEFEFVKNLDKAIQYVKENGDGIYEVRYNSRNKEFVSHILICKNGEVKIQNV